PCGAPTGAPSCAGRTMQRSRRSSCSGGTSPGVPRRSEVMNRINVACLAGFLMVLLSNNVPGADRHVRTDLVAADGSGVIGVVEMTQMPNGGVTGNVTASHLPGSSTYTAYAYETGAC